MTRWVRSLRFFFEMEAMIDERLALLERPEEEDLLHWSRSEKLHGCLLPPADGRRHSVTSDGWCPCSVAEENQAAPDWAR
jgi:hypothetical protein